MTPFTPYTQKEIHALCKHMPTKEDRVRLSIILSHYATLHELEVRIHEQSRRTLSDLLRDAAETIDEQSDIIRNHTDI